MAFMRSLMVGKGDPKSRSKSSKIAILELQAKADIL
jgi:hypothetical protein